ncbi:hypothetical protein [Candidatus Poriferisocius sp.]|uniref:hypothetical protein n=1 Tax=Candidatus Poriferisocius sp. TaxID=3101276 RepID=UPI003B5A53C3
MTTHWQSFFDRWAAPPSQTEIDERNRTERQIKAALLASPAVARRNFRLFVKGSYRSGTNVRRGPDVDLAVELLGASESEQNSIVHKAFGAQELPLAQLGLREAPIEYRHALKTFKDDCFDALVDAFGPTQVDRHNKCIRVSEKSTTLPADVVPCATHRRYDSVVTYHDGIEITPDQGHKIINWPQQDYDNGVRKNDRTSRRYKRVVRGLKALENRMAELGLPETPSWLVECLVYNVPNSVFDSPSNYVNVFSTLLWLSKELESTTGRGEWHEVNELKYLFASTQPWSIQDAQSFVSQAMRFLAP